MIIHLQTKTELSVMIKHTLPLVTLVLKFIAILPTLSNNKTVHIALEILVQ